MCARPSIQKGGGDFFSGGGGGGTSKVHIKRGVMTMNSGMVYVLTGGGGGC